jgi:hypothetical protein
MLTHSGGILLDKLLDVRQHQDFSVGPALYRFLAERRNNVTLARPSGKYNARVLELAYLKPFTKIIKNSPLVIP